MRSVKHAYACLDYLQDTTSVISNLLSENNRNSWEQLERVIHMYEICSFNSYNHVYTYVQTSPSTGQSLVKSTEQVTKLLSETLTNDNTEAMQARTNIGITKVCLMHGL